ncbi:hypothetical protein QL285_041111 [Trifolium repens]|jgi:hypothetical protein|nr:hypothetical protein QL285_041111 [Trifolium repens]
MFDSCRSDCVEWFENSVCRRIGDGSDTRFWLHNWVEEITLKDKFPRLFVSCFAPMIGVKDKWVWKDYPVCGDSVSAGYKLLLSRCMQDHLSKQLRKAIHLLWKFSAPSKILVFGWRVLQRRIATMDALQMRGILGHNCDLLCVFSRCEAEICDHLFLSCPIAKINKINSIKLQK